MRTIDFIFDINEIFSLVSGITFTRDYDLDPSKNSVLVEKYGMSEDENYLFMNYLKIAADVVWDNIKCHSPNEDFEFDSFILGRRVIKYVVDIGKSNDEKIKDYMLLTMRDYILKEWYLNKGATGIYQEYEYQFNQNINRLIMRGAGMNKDTGRNTLLIRNGFFS